MNFENQTRGCLCSLYTKSDEFWEIFKWVEGRGVFFIQNFIVDFFLTNFGESNLQCNLPIVGGRVNADLEFLIYKKSCDLVNGGTPKSALFGRPMFQPLTLTFVAWQLKD